MAEATPQERTRGIADEEAELPSSAWAYEFLRRNAEFRAVLQAAAAPERASLGSIQIVDLSLDIAERFEHFGVLYASEAGQAPEVMVIWTPALNPDVIDARMTPAGASGEDAGLLRLATLGCEKFLLRIDGVISQILLRDGLRHIQINCLEAINEPESAIIPQIAPARNVDRQLLVMRRLLHLYSEGQFADSLFRPDGNGPRYREVLKAYDLWRVGTPLREIAVALYGARIVEADWAAEGGYLIERVRRTIRRGRYLVDGGYRKIVG